MKKITTLIMLVFLAGAGMVLTQCAGARKAPAEMAEEVIYTNRDGQGAALNLIFLKGKEHNHPLMALWVENTEGEYIETLYVAESIGKGIFRHGDRSKGKWEPGEVRRPAALPYWGHKRGVRASDGYYLPEPTDPVPDAITGPTPQESFIIDTKLSDRNMKRFNILLELNQSWDWNEYWTNDKYPDDVNYKTSSQPAIVYMAEIDLDQEQDLYELKPIGHSHYSGKDGELYEDLSTLTTALDIAGEIKLKVIRE